MPSSLSEKGREWLGLLGIQITLRWWSEIITLWSLRLIEFHLRLLSSLVFSSWFLQVYIVGHMPPGSDERQIGIIPNGHTTYSEKNNLRYLRLIRKYSSIIQGQFFGHLHSDSFRIVYNDMGKTWISFFPAYASLCTNATHCLLASFFFI